MGSTMPFLVLVFFPFKSLKDKSKIFFCLIGVSNLCGKQFCYRLWERKKKNPVANAFYITKEPSTKENWENILANETWLLYRPRAHVHIEPYKGTDVRNLCQVDPLTSSENIFALRFLYLSSRIALKSPSVYLGCRISFKIRIGDKMNAIEPNEEFNWKIKVFLGELSGTTDVPAENKCLNWILHLVLQTSFWHHFEFWTMFDML